MQYNITYSEQLLCLKDDALDRYETVAVELKKKMHMRADSIEVKSVSTNPDFPCLRSALQFEALLVQQAYNLVFLNKNRCRAARDALEDDLVRREDIKSNREQVERSYGGSLS